MTPSESDHPPIPDREDDLSAIERLTDFETGPIAERLRYAAAECDRTARAIVAARPLRRAPWLDGVPAGESSEERDLREVVAQVDRSAREGVPADHEGSTVPAAVMPSAVHRPRRGSWMVLAVAATVALLGALSLAFEWGRAVGAGDPQQRLARRAPAMSDDGEPIFTAAWRPIADGVPSAAGERYLTALGAPSDCRVEAGDRTDRSVGANGRSFDCCTRCHRSGAERATLEQRPERVLRNCAVCHVAAPQPACERGETPRHSEPDVRPLDPAPGHGSAGRCGDCHVAADLATPDEAGPFEKRPFDAGRASHGQGRVCKECHLATSERPRLDPFEVRLGDALRLACVLR